MNTNKSMSPRGSLTILTVLSTSLLALSKPLPLRPLLPPAHHWPNSSRQTTLTSLWQIFPCSLCLLQHQPPLFLPPCSLSHPPWRLPALLL
ncbi:hypothetical protein F5H01DRAFT_329309 [Linnemannia elongata]|nr:hypothetical protein F5H01DRAFT_329309 [Linnemannia elongata]